MAKHSNKLTAREVFASNLRLIRRMKNISQENLALTSELSRTYISEVERGIRNVSIDNMEKLARTLDVPLKWLVDPDTITSMSEKLR